LTDHGEEILRRFPAKHEPAVSDLYLSPDGRFLAYSRGKSPNTNEGRKFCLRDLDSADGSFILKDEPCEYWHGFAFDPQGKELARICQFAPQNS
jgi:hypothetical protein